MIGIGRVEGQGKRRSTSAHCMDIAGQRCLMKPIVYGRLLMALSVLGSPGCATAQSGAAGAPRIVGYYFAPSARSGFPVDSIDGNRLTHINYAFANIDANGRAVLGFPCLDIGRCVDEQNPNKSAGGNFEALRRLKQRYPQLRTLISIGGWDWSGRFSDAAATPEARARFIQSTLDLFIRGAPGAFDGIDLDWEYPVSGGLPGNRTRPEDRRNYTLLLQEFRRALDDLGRRDNRRYLLTIAAPAGAANARNFELAALGGILDFINVMSYDYHTGGRTAHFNAPLDVAPGDPTPENTVVATVNRYLEAGVPKEKLVVGVPFFGYGYGGVPAKANGLFQPAERNGFEPSAPRAAWLGSTKYRDISKALRSGFQRHWEPKAGVPWLYNASTRSWITYDDAQSIALKADLVKRRGLGGVMIWELSGDDGTLLPTLHRRLRQ